MDWLERLTGVGSWLARVASVGVVAAAAVLLMPIVSFAREGDWYRSAFWFAVAAAFGIYGTTCLATLVDAVPQRVRFLLTPLVKLAAIGFTLAGGAWGVHAIERFHETAHFEGYLFAFPALMAVQGAIVYWVLERASVRTPAASA